MIPSSNIACRFSWIGIIFDRDLPGVDLPPMKFYYRKSKDRFTNEDLNIGVYRDFCCATIPLDFSFEATYLDRKRFNRHRSFLRKKLHRHRRGDEEWIYPRRYFRSAADPIYGWIRVLTRVLLSSQRDGFVHFG